eukprot:9486339-Pyramimonas_sp.AAC.1
MAEAGDRELLLRSVDREAGLRHHGLGLANELASLLPDRRVVDQHGGPRPQRLGVSLELGELIAKVGALLQERIHHDLRPFQHVWLQREHAWGELGELLDVVSHGDPAAAVGILEQRLPRRICCTHSLSCYRERTSSSISGISGRGSTTGGGDDAGATASSGQSESFLVHERVSQQVGDVLGSGDEVNALVGERVAQ